MRLIVVSIMVTLLSGCGSIISRTIPGQGHGNQYYPEYAGNPLTDIAVTYYEVRCPNSQIREVSEKESHRQLQELYKLVFFS